MVEEIPDAEWTNLGPTFPEGVNALLMTEEEYLDTLQRREKPGPTTTKNAKAEKRQHNRPRYAEPKTQECQLTSLKVKVKDLVTDDQDEQRIVEERHDQIPRSGHSGIDLSHNHSLTGHTNHENCQAMTSQGKHLTHRPCTTLSDQPLTLLDGVVSSTSGMGDSGHKVPCEVLIKSEQGSAVVKSFRAR
jgi:hypothetical protein